MNYMLKSGHFICPSDPAVRLRIRKTLSGPEKKILSDDDRLYMKTEIVKSAGSCNGDVRIKEYRLLDPQNRPVAVAHPEYAPNEDPVVNGWPLSHMPKVDHADLSFRNTNYRLFMENSQTYHLLDHDGKKIVSFQHNGLPGGWKISDSTGFSPEILCGFFIFCRYIEQENEFLVV